MCFIVIAILSISVGLVVSIVPVLSIGWGGLGGLELCGVSSHSPLECGFGYSVTADGVFLYYHSKVDLYSIAWFHLILVVLHLLLTLY